jgi:hypothetical protein
VTRGTVLVPHSAVLCRHGAGAGCQHVADFNSSPGYPRIEFGSDEEFGNDDDGVIVFGSDPGTKTDNSTGATLQQDPYPSASSGHAVRYMLSPSWSYIATTTSS